MECSVCWGDLLEAPANGPVPPKAKKSKVDTSKPKSENCCLPCGHVFHRQCITSWFSKQNPNHRNNAASGTCPTCRKQVGEKQFYPVYFSVSTQKSRDQIIEMPQEEKKENDKQPSEASAPVQPQQPSFSPMVPLFSPSPPNPNTSTFKAKPENISCENTECCDLQMRFNLLQQDHEEIIKKLEKERERGDCFEAMLKSMANSMSSEEETGEEAAETEEVADAVMALPMLADEDSDSDYSDEDF